MGHASRAKELVAMNYSIEYSESALVKEGINAPDDFLLNKGWIKVMQGQPAHIYYDDKVSDEAIKKLLEIEAR
jgi:hypothetical protein